MAGKVDSEAYWHYLIQYAKLGGKRRRKSAPAQCDVHSKMPLLGCRLGDEEWYSISSK